MKLNPQLKKALRAHEKTLAPDHSTPPARTSKKHKESHPPELRFQRGEKVVGGDILRKPIDKTAALVVKKAPWWAQAPPELPAPEPKQLTPKPKKTMDYYPALKGPQFTTKNEPGVIQDTAIVKKLTSMAGKEVAEAEDLLTRANDARVAMDVMANSFKTSWIEFAQSGDERLKELRMLRLANEGEIRQLMASFREVRQFFLDKDYATEIARLKDFVDTCERLQKLKESGFLDSVADTMLKLSK